MKRFLTGNQKVALCLSLLFAATAFLPACKSQDPAILLSVTGQFRIPEDANGLRIDVYDTQSNQLVVTQEFTLSAGSNFPYTVTLVESGEDHPEIKIVATATLNGSQVGIGDVEVQFRNGATFNAAIDLAATE